MYGFEKNEKPGVCARQDVVRQDPVEIAERPDAHGLVEKPVAAVADRIAFGFSEQLFIGRAENGRGGDETERKQERALHRQYARQPRRCMGDEHNSTLCHEAASNIKNAALTGAADASPFDAPVATASAHRPSV